MQNEQNTRPGTASRLDRELVVLAGVVVLGTIMTVLDLTIVNVAIPTLGREFEASISTIQWVMTAYMLAFASVIPLAGWASERFGAKQVWTCSLLVFLAGSLLAGASWSIGSLIGFRVVQGLGAGMIVPVGQTILAQAAGPQRMGRMMALVGVPMLLAPVFGPVLGGAIVGQAGWRWLFYLNLPVGAAALLAAHRLLPKTSTRPRQRLDLRGLVLLSPGIAVFLYGITEAGARGGFGRTTSVVATLVGLALIGLFVWHALMRGNRALIDLSLFRRRAFAAAATLNFLLVGALFGSLILLPLYYQLVRSERPLDVGLLLVPQGLGAALTMPISGWLTDRVGARAVVTTGIAVAVGAILAYTRIGAGTSYAYLAVALFVLGLGIGATIAPSMAALYQTLTREETPRATSALNVIQRAGGAIGTALFAIVLQHAIASNLPGLHGGLEQLAMLAPEHRADIASSLADAFGTTFMLATVLIAATLIPALLLPRPPRRDRSRPVVAAAETGTPRR